MSNIGFTKVLNIGEGALVVQSPLTPISYPSNEDVLGKVGELSIMHTDGSNLTYTFPATTAPGQMCGVKTRNLSNSGSQISLQSAQPLYAGIANEPMDEMTFIGQVGEAAFFVSGIDQDETLAWYLLAYNPGSTFAP